MRILIIYIIQYMYRYACSCAINLCCSIKYYDNLFLYNFIFYIVCIPVPVLEVCNQGLFFLCCKNTTVCFLFSLSHHELSFFDCLSICNHLFIVQGSVMFGNSLDEIFLQPLHLFSVQYCTTFLVPLLVSFLSHVTSYLLKRIHGVSTGRSENIG